MKFSQEGEYHSSGQFTLDSALAWKKLRAHQVLEPARYACQLVAASVTLGARWVDIHFEPKLARLHLRGCRVRRGDLESLLSRPAGHPLTLGLLGAQSFYAKGCRLRLVCDGGVCVIEGDSLSLAEGDSFSGLQVEVVALGGSFFSPARLEHGLARQLLEEECQDGVLPIEVNGRALTRPVSLGDNLTTLRLNHPDAGMPEFMGRPFEVRDLDSPGPFCGLVGCLSHRQETVISNGRVLLRRATPGFSAFLFLLEAPLDLSGELVGGGQEILDSLQTLVKRTMLEWTRREDVPEAFRERLYDYWLQWFQREPEGPLGEALEFTTWSGQRVSLREISRPYVADWNAGSAIFHPDPLLLRFFPQAVRLPPPPAGLLVTFDSSLPVGLEYHPDRDRVEIVVHHPARYQEALSAAQVLPPGAYWVTAQPGPGVAGQFLELLAEAARDPARLGEVVSYLGWAAQRFHSVVQKLLGLRMRVGGKVSLPPSALDAMLGRADETSLAWMVDGGLLVGLGELERIPFLLRDSGELVSLLQLQAASKVYINQEHPDSLRLDASLVEPLQQFVGAVRRGLVM